ncbi:tetratricopeptide repeat protein [Geobacter sp. FeAm09]|uniref:tetratricopeptide repeat protein n=1 Tax=Geobacter sp. FeAm09 TaxID=2597769 RepID=UPI00143D5AA7|nr:tetratricopeptide repeat protein [Geobacter sp. FeAm09]
MTAIERQLELLSQYESRQEWDAAEALCLDLLSQYPRQVPLLVQAAAMARRRQASGVAEALLYRALAIDPLNTAAYLSLGMARYEQGDPDEAERYFRKALLVSRGEDEAGRHLGTLLNEQGRFLETVALLGVAQRRNPEATGITLCLADASYGAGRFAEAYPLYRSVLDRQPGNVNALISMGALCEHLDRLDEAWRHLIRARELAPGNPKVHLNLGGVCRRTLRLQEALDHYGAALALQPGYPTALWNICQIELLLGRYREGFRDFDSRFATSQPVRLRRTALPYWNGEPATGKRLLVQCEQAYGDTLQFARYIPQLAAGGMRIVLENHHAPLDTLLLSLEGVERMVSDGSGDAACDAVCPLLSLPRLLGTTLHTAPSMSPISPHRRQKGRPGRPGWPKTPI